MRKGIWSFLVVLFLLSFLTSGCYYFSAKRDMKAAQGLISNLKGEGGEKLVPYEYTSAEKFLEVSKMEFDEHDYQSAKVFAEHSKSAAEMGLSEVKKKK